MSLDKFNASGGKTAAVAPNSMTENGPALSGLPARVTCFANEGDRAGDVVISTGDTSGAAVSLEVDGSTVEFPANEMVVSGDFTIRHNTADAADNKTITIASGGSPAATRGARISLFGNEASSGGLVRISSGEGAAADVIFQTGGNTRWTIDENGNLFNDTTNGASLTFNRIGTGIAYQMGTEAAAGSTQTDAEILSHNLNYVTGADTTKGVKLQGLGSYGNGFEIKIINASASTLKLYSNAVGELINGVAGTTAYVVAARAIVSAIRIDSTNWAVG